MKFIALFFSLNLLVSCAFDNSKNQFTTSIPQLRETTIAQVPNFDVKIFMSAGFDAWSSALGKQQNTYLRCVELCKGTGFLWRTPATLPPFYYRINWSFKTTVNCSNEIRGLRPMCNGMLRVQDLIQIGGNQYMFPLDMKLKYHQAQKYCRSRNLELASLRSPKLDSHLIATYLKSFATLSAENKAAISGNASFWEFKTDGADNANVMLCPTFTYFNITEPTVINASRVMDQCTNVNMFICEVPNICFKDICRGNFISKYKMVPPPSPPVAGTVTTTAKPGVTTTTTTTSMPFICEQCHLNHTLLYAKACPGIACPTCWGIQPPDVPGKGKDLGECNGKSYFYVDTKGSHASAMAKCCALGMRSVSIATDDDSECIKEYINLLLDRRDMAGEERLIWTSATDAGSNCQGRFTWCNGGTNGAVNALTRLNYDQTVQASSDDCMAMMVKTVGSEMQLIISAKPCIMPLPVICEAPIPANSKHKTSVLSKRGGQCEGKVGSCPKLPDPTPLPRTVYNNENERFVDGPKRYGFICDKQYTVSPGPVDKFDLLGKFCLDQRLEVGFVESFEELNCIRDRHLATAAKDPSTLDKGLTLAWLKGTDQNCPRGSEGPAWCSNGATINSYLMKVGSAGSRCVSIEMRSSKFSIVSAVCDKAQEYYVCKETCAFPTCPKVSCVVTKNGESLATKVCGGFYLAVEEKKTMADAMEHCCTLGMSLLSMETATETGCIGKWVRESLSSLTPLWTSGTDLNCKGNYAWCSTGEMFAREAFQQFYVSPGTGVEDDSNLEHHCVSAVFINKFPVKHQMCDNKLSFICEKVGKSGRSDMWPQSPSLRNNYNTTFF